LKIGKVLVTSAWPYINATPHLGTLVGSLLSADVYARYCRLKGEETVMVSGSDEHGTPIQVEAVRMGITPKQLADRNHERVSELLRRWDISFDNYTRTESLVHKEFVQDHFMKIYDNGFIFAQDTEMLYCEHCGRFLPDRFVEGRCPYCGHGRARGDQCDACGRLLEPTLLIEPYCTICGTKPVVKKTKHWYFDLAKLSDSLTDFLKKNKQLTTATRNFSLSLFKDGLKPRAITRDVTRNVEWGIPAPFPGAEGKTIYVWFEAVLGYVSATIEYFKNTKKPEAWKEYWFDKEAETFYFIGKDNIIFHTIILPALLLASGEDYNLPTNVSATEWLRFEGERASKSHGVGITIDQALELFPADYWRFFLMASRPETKDTDFTWELFIDKINADLNDTFGNFIHRTLTFINSQFDGEIPQLDTTDADVKRILENINEKVNEIAADFEHCRIQAAANTVIGISRCGNQYLNEKEPWKLLKTNRTQAANIVALAARIVKILAIVSEPFMPSTAEEIWKTLNLEGNVRQQRWDEALEPFIPQHKIGKPKPLFKKIDEDKDDLEAKLAVVRDRSSEKAPEN
jgi:methionyl-tRNA synthetase